MNSTNEKVEILAETEITDTKNVDAMSDAEMMSEKSSTPDLPDYDKATENQVKDAEESSIPEFRSQTPTELFAATESTIESSLYPTEPVTNQPQVVQPAGHHVRVHPVPVAAVVTSNPPAIHTSCCECDGPWCSYCCCGFCCNPCTGLSLNRKLHGTSSLSQCMWQWDIILTLLFVILGSVAGTMSFYHGIRCYDYTEPEDDCPINYWLIIAMVCSSILTIIAIVRIYSRFVQRRLFLRNQAEKGHYPNNEGCIASFLCSWCCSPCIFGQMNSAIEKQRFLSLMQPQHTLSYNV